MKRLAVSAAVTGALLVAGAAYSSHADAQEQREDAMAVCMAEYPDIALCKLAVSLEEEAMKRKGPNGESWQPYYFKQEQPGLSRSW